MCPSTHVLYTESLCPISGVEMHPCDVICCVECVVEAKLQRCVGHNLQQSDAQPPVEPHGTMLRHYTLRCTYHALVHLHTPAGAGHSARNVVDYLAGGELRRRKGSCIAVIYRQHSAISVSNSNMCFPISYTLVEHGIYAGLHAMQCTAQRQKLRSHSIESSAQLHV